MKTWKNMAILAIIGITFFLFACDTTTGPETKTQYYYYEFFRISKANYNSVSLPSSATFNAIKSYRNSLKNYSVEFIASGTDATQQDIYDLMTSRGISASDANNEISLMNSIGNDVLIFEYALNNRHIRQHEKDVIDYKHGKEEKIQSKQSRGCF